MRSAPRTIIPLLLAACLVAPGCQKAYRAETILHPDGRVERAIYQPANDTPAIVKLDPGWKQTTFAPNPDGLEHQGWNSTIDQLPIHEADKDHEYFAAWGTFPAVRDLPEHVHVAPPENTNLPDGKLVREYVRNDYVFAVEHQWRETLTDIVSEADMRKAREELADFAIGVAADTFEEAVGQEYDAGNMIRWLRNEAKPWWVELTDFAFLFCATHKGPAAPKGLALGGAVICARHGLLLTNKSVLLEEEDLSKVVKEFAVTQVCKGVRHKKDGTAVDRKTAAAWLDDLTNNVQNDSKPRVFRPALEKVIATKYGGKEAYEARLETLALRTFGLHYPGWLFNHCQFDYTLTMPGDVVETNGLLLTGNRVRWLFQAREAYPLGYDMTCRCVSGQAQAQRDLLKEQVLDTREALVQFVNLAGSQPGLAEALRECRKQKKMKPLYEYHQKMREAPGSSDPVRDVSRLLRLLKLPEQPIETKANGAER
jgi:hypothetical protein